MVTKNNIMIISGILLVISGVTHISQLWVYPTDVSAIGASIFGILYFVIGVILLLKYEAGLWLSIIFPVIGGVLGVYRFIFLHSNPFTIFHLIIDIIVITLSTYAIFKKR